MNIIIASFVFFITIVFSALVIARGAAEIAFLIDKIFNEWFDD